MLYYPPSTLSLAGIRDILIMSTLQDTLRFQQLLGDCAAWGLNLSCSVKPSQDSLVQAFLIGKSIIGGASSALLLGENLFYGHDFQHLLEKAGRQASGASVFAYHVSDLELYGLVAFDAKNRACTIEKKPAKAKSNYDVTRLFLYDNQVVCVANSI